MIRISHLSTVYKDFFREWSIFVVNGKLARRPARSEGGNWMRIAIVEDRPEDQASLSALLAADAAGRGWLNETELFDSGEAFLTAAGSFDLVFLDVIMGGIDGLETARRFRAKGGNALIVFVTVEADFAIEGYEVDAAAFLVKPAKPEQFRRVMDRLARKLQKDVTLTLAPGQEVPAGSVLYAAAADHYLKVYTADKTFFPRLSLEGFRALLPDGGRFLECSRGVLVNLDRVVKIDAKVLSLTDGTRLPVSRRRRQALVDAIAARKFDAAREDLP